MYGPAQHTTVLHTTVLRRAEVEYEVKVEVEVPGMMTPNIKHDTEFVLFQVTRWFQPALLSPTYPLWLILFHTASFEKCWPKHASTEVWFCLCHLPCSARRGPRQSSRCQT